MWALTDLCLTIVLLALIMSSVLGGYRVVRNKIGDVVHTAKINNIWENKIPAICDVRPEHEESEQTFSYKIDKPGSTLIHDINLVLHCPKISKLMIEQAGRSVDLQNIDTTLNVKKRLSEAGIRLDLKMQITAYENPGLWV